MTSERRRALLTLGLPLAVFAVRVAHAGWAQRDGINPDAVAYLRNALYWTQGRFADAISGYWSPMFSWGAVPGILLGFDALHAARLAVAAWGAALVVLCWLLMRRLVELPVWLETIAMLLVADATLMWATTAFPDVILAAGLAAFAVVLWSRRFLERRRLQVLAGACGAVAFLGKAYGFPFFLLWCPLSIAWRAGDRRRALAAWGFAMLGFAIVAGPWIGALSLKYGRPTYGLAGGINRAVVGPAPVDARQWWTPVPGRVTLWETPEAIDWGRWSPFDSAAAMRHQVAYSWRIAKEVIASLARFDLLGLSVGLTLLAPFLAAALGRGEQARRLGWIAGTVVLYAAPFVLVYFTYRYTAPLLRPLCLFACLQAAWTLSRRTAAIPAALLLLGVIVSFAAHANVPYRPHLVEEEGVTPFNDITVDGAPHRKVAAELRKLGAGGPIASNLYWGGMYVAYFADAPFVGMPGADASEPCDAQLRAHGVRTFLAERTGACAEAIAADPSWRRLTTLAPESGETIDVYVPVAP
jgi:hypothetical protein